mmetsp:Transcript_22131/g.69249  ORF Transcript_22131/g.69249 Transcript_22131/m.69249 type:complete len:217 (+) Transcript_22131:616-1266(+)
MRVFWPESTHEDSGGSLSNWQCFLVLSLKSRRVSGAARDVPCLRAQQRSKVVERTREVRVFRTKAFLADGDGAFVKRHRLLDFPLERVRGGKVVQRSREIRVLRTKGFLHHGDGAFVQRHRFLEPPLRLARETSLDWQHMYFVLKQASQVLEDAGEIRVIATARFLDDGDGAFVERCCFSDPSLGRQQQAEVVQDARQVGVLGTESFLANGNGAFV